MVDRLRPSRRFLRLFVLFLAATLVPVMASAQGASGTISGTASDATGGVLPGVTITIRNDDTGAVRELVSADTGRFHAPNLPPGPYTVTAALSGFQTMSRKNIVLTVGREAVVDFAMGVGQVADVVNVVGEISTIDTPNASTGGLINEEQIKNLPLNGRSFIELANLTPGVQLTNQGGRSTSTGFGQKISVNGSRYTQNLFTLDGTMMNDQFNQAGSASGNMLGVEAVREFQVLTNSFSAEYGRHTGAVINAATKTGTNAFRGSVFEFHRNEALDAKRWEAEAEQPAGAGFQPQPVRLLGRRPDHPEQDVLLRHLRGSARAPRHNARLTRCRPQRCATPASRDRAAVPRRVSRRQRHRARRPARRIRAPGLARHRRVLR